MCQNLTNTQILARQAERAQVERRRAADQITGAGKVLTAFNTERLDSVADCRALVERVVADLNSDFDSRYQQQMAATGYQQTH